MSSIYRNKFIGLVLWIFIVMGLFRFISDRRIAATIAGIGFIILPMYLIFSETKLNRKNWFVILTSVVFLFFSALPIFYLRVFNWEADFKDLNFLGIPSDFLHKTSNKLYLLMLISVLGSYFLYIFSNSKRK
jgi:hypothetical protein